MITSGIIKSHMATSGHHPITYLPMSMLSTTHCSPTLYGLIFSFSMRAACPATSFAITTCVTLAAIWVAIQ